MSHHDPTPTAAAEMAAAVTVEATNASAGAAPSAISEEPTVTSASALSSATGQPPDQPPPAAAQPTPVNTQTEGAQAAGRQHADQINQLLTAMTAVPSHPQVEFVQR